VGEDTKIWICLICLKLANIEFEIRFEIFTNGESPIGLCKKKALASEHFVKAEIETFRPLNQDPHHRLFHITSLPPRKDMRLVETSEDKRLPSTYLLSEVGILMQSFAPT